MQTTKEIQKSSSPKASPLWQSFEERKALFSEDKPTHLPEQKEFLSTPMGVEASQEGFDRRDFLTLMGASMALGAAGCIRRPAEKIVPYAQRPMEVIPGIANEYTSVYTESAGEYLPLVVKTQEGRPLYAYGNTKAPYGGGISVRGVSHVLSLYDPDRLQTPQVGDRKGSFRATDWSDIDEKVLSSLSQGPEPIWLTGLLSPSLQQALDDMREIYGGLHRVWNPAGLDDVVAAQLTSFGAPGMPTYHLDRARVVVSLGSDFLGTDLQSVQSAALFAKGRRPESGEMNRLIVFESLLSLTGANADERFRVKPSQYAEVGLLLVEQLVRAGHISDTNPALQKMMSVTSSLSEELSLPDGMMSKLANELWENRGHCVFLAPQMCFGKREVTQATHIVSHFLNSILGQEVSGVRSVPLSFEPGLGREAWPSLQGRSLIIYGGNPAYCLGDKVWEQQTQGCRQIIYMTDRLDETAQKSDLILPLSHPMEDWGDASSFGGVFYVQQPTISPLYKTRGFGENLRTWGQASERAGGRRLREAKSWYEYVRGRWRERVGAQDFELVWNQVLETGFWESGRQQVEPNRAFRMEALNAITLLRVEKLRSKTEGSSNLELMVYQKSAIGDGSAANLAWLQELPDPITKVTWDNYAMISYKRAEELGFSKDGHLVRLQTKAGDLTLPLVRVPGVHDDVVGVAMGYGRTHAGRVGSHVGGNVMKLVNWQPSLVPHVSEVQVTALAGFYELANVQGHHPLRGRMSVPRAEETTSESVLGGRSVVAHTTWESYQKNPKSGTHPHKLFSLWPKHEYKGHRWAMTVDLSLCTGCSACVVACQSENNVPSVGKQYVMEGREMHWLRLDRYYSGEPESAQVLMQPMLCQHCENASCETVCPVSATTHSPEGLNEMTYNRCVGTRYCSNNCPYKVRRFNWFNYSNVPKPQEMAFNPEVTVRSRGVMEKCTFCTHRITSAKHRAKREGRELQDGDVVTACQEACPTDAIVFGDVNNDQSRVAQQFQNPRSHAVLEEYNNVPMVKYQTKVRNVAGGDTEHGHGEGHNGHGGNGSHNDHAHNGHSLEAGEDSK